MNTAYVWKQQKCVCVEWACVFGLLAVNTYSNWIVSLSTSHSKSILYSAFSTSLFHSKIDGFLNSHKTKFKPDANLIFYFPTTWSSTIYAIIPCPYLSTPTPPFIFISTEILSRDFCLLWNIYCIFQFYYLLSFIVNQYFKCLSPG